MKITEVWQNKDEFLKLCRDNKACEDEYERCIEADTEDGLLEIVSRNFNWCVTYGVLEEWLPKVLNTKKLDCGGCTGLTELPELPNNEWLYCYECTGLTGLPALPKNECLYCNGCTGLVELPALSNNRWLYCYKCTSLTKIPALPKNELLSCDDRLKGGLK